MLFRSKEFFNGDYNIEMKWAIGINSWTEEGDVDKNGRQKSPTIQQRAAMKSNDVFGTHLGVGSKPWLCLMKKLKNGEKYDVIAMDIDDDPADFGDIDYNAMWERNVKNPLERIIETLDWSWSYLETGKRQGDQSNFW